MPATTDSEAGNRQVTKCAVACEDTAIAQYKRANGINVSRRLVICSRADCIQDCASQLQSSDTLPPVALAQPWMSKDRARQSTASYASTVAVVTAS
jgi:hypothetical protein